MSLSFLIEMAWKSAFIAGAALLLVTLLRSRSAADRAAILRVAVGLLLLLPIIALAVPRLEISAPVAVEPIVAVTHAPREALAEPVAMTARSPEPAVSFVEAGSSVFADWTLLAALVYLTGLLAMALRLGAGLFTLRQWTLKAAPVSSPAWLSALAKADQKGISPRLLVSEDVSGPISWGWRRSVILIDMDSLERTEDADAIVIHEMAHVMRRDWAVLILARTAVALFWFNPLVWLLEREVVQQAEEAADSTALAQVERAHYAQTLVTCAKYNMKSHLPVNSIAPSGSRLARRVRAVLDGKGLSTPSGSRWTLAAIVGCVGFAAPVAALQLIPAPAAPAAPMVEAAPAAPGAVQAPLAALAALVAAPAPAPEAPQAAMAPAAPIGDTPYDADEEELDRASEEAERAAERVAEAAERVAARAEREAERATREGERLSREGERASREGERIAREAERMARGAEQRAAQAQRAAAASMVAGAKNMMSGADSMEAGARNMDEEAVKLRDRNYREQQIAKAAARGENMTHERLIKMIPEMQRGAEEMRRGAKEMRVGAEQMRRQAT